MRILTVIAGVVLTAIGAFCFLFMSSFNFAALAFPIGTAMLAAGICIVGAFLASGRQRRISDTVLVEGVVMAVFGFVVLNNQVKDAMLPIFFGSLLVISGASRVAQSFDVSRYRPKDWAKVMVFAIPTIALGLIMMMPSAISTDTPLMLVGASFIINGFSMLIYAMFMESRSSEEKASELKARAEAKKKAAEEKRKQRDELRKLSRDEQNRIKAANRKIKKAEAERKREERRLEKEAERRSRQPATKDTISFTKEESEEIKAAAKALGYEDEATEEKTQQPQESSGNKKAETKEEAPQKAEPENTIWPSFKKPEAIPSLRNKAKGETPEAAPEDIKITAIKLDEIEEKTPEISFDSPELPDVELSAKGGEAKERDEILSELDKEIELPESFTDYEALKLEDLIPEELPKSRLYSPDDKSFTQRLTINWTPEPEFDSSIEAVPEKEREESKEESKEDSNE